MKIKLLLTGGALLVLGGSLFVVLAYFFTPEKSGTILSLAVFFTIVAIVTIWTIWRAKQ